jgi:hypothetical protein
VTTEQSKGMTQTAPYPHELQELVLSCTYRPDWTVKMMTIVRDPADTHGAEGAGLTLIITTSGYDSYHPERGQNYRVNHYFIVPAATFNRKSWMRWLFDCFVDVETHETMEFFTIDGEKPFAPLHGPGENPYVVHEYADSAQKATRFNAPFVSD